MPARPSSSAATCRATTPTACTAQSRSTDVLTTPRGTRAELGPPRPVDCRASQRDAPATRRSTFVLVGAVTSGSVTFLLGVGLFPGGWTGLTKQQFASHSGKADFA